MQTNSVSLENCHNVKMSAIDRKVEQDVDFGCCHGSYFEA